MKDSFEILTQILMQLNREEKRRLEAEKREYDAHADLEMCHSALHGAQQEKIQLEAELMEAAADVLEQQALQSACREIQKTCQVEQCSRLLPVLLPGLHFFGGCKDQDSDQVGMVKSY